MVAIFILILYLAVLYGIATMAERYGRHAVPWVLLGLVIGVFAFIPLAAAGVTEDERIRRLRADEQARGRPRYPPAPTGRTR